MAAKWEKSEFQATHHCSKPQATIAVTRVELEPQSQIAIVGVLFTIFVVVLIVTYILNRYRQNWGGAIEEPFESVGEQSIWSFLRPKLPRMWILILIIVIVIGIPSIFFIGRMPVHRTNITHTDPEGDVSDPNCDIVQITSYRDGIYVAIEMQVAGSIQENNDSLPYGYWLIIVSRGIEEGHTDSHIISLYYEDGTVSEPGLPVSVENDTLRLLVPFSRFNPDSYMIGLEGAASNGFEEDLTPVDRNGTVARLLF
ncbi:MAG: hypothetical protein GF309_11645 [Candidatus Lokiarchaeota archaeon]|nr:hypothetical protein [Candidatus Lokiarchaeota archaeon]